MTEILDVDKPREGTHFRGKIDRNCLSLFVERHRGSIFTTFGSFHDVDAAFQAFIDSHNFSMIRDRQIQAILETYAQEKQLGINWKEKTYRFLNAGKNERFKMMGDPGMSYILTTDKSDILESEQRKAHREAEEKKEQLLYERILTGDRVVEPQPLSEEEQELVERIENSEVLHYFGRGLNCPPLAYIDVEPVAYIIGKYPDGRSDRFNKTYIEPEEINSLIERARRFEMLDEEELQILDAINFSPRKGTSLGGDEFLALLVRAELATNDQIRDLFENPPENFNVINWLALGWQKWPSIKDAGPGQGLAALADLLGKKGIQRYAWDGGYGDISESWMTAFIESDGEIRWEGTQTYGAMKA